MGLTFDNISAAAEAIFSWNLSSILGTNLADLKFTSDASPPPGVFNFLPFFNSSGTVSIKGSKTCLTVLKSFLI